MSGRPGRLVAAAPGGGAAEVPAAPSGSCGTALAQVIGVAIGIPEPFATELQSWRRWVGDPMADLIPPHITLLPPTELDAHRLAEAERHLRAVAGRHQPFEIGLAGTDTFQPVSDVVFVTVSGGTDQCALLERDVRAGPLHRPVTFPYHPHVTVAHDVQQARLAAALEGLGRYRAAFPVTVFTLFEQGRDGMWRRSRDFRLSGCPGAAGGAGDGSAGGPA